MSRYVFSYYDGDELVLYRESQTPDDPESDMPYLGFHKECTEAIVEYIRRLTPTLRVTVRLQTT